MSSDRSLYEIIGVTQTANTQEIERACLILGEQFHPDRQLDGAEKVIARLRFSEIEKAYEVLTDPIKRASYDETIRSKTVNMDRSGARTEEKNDGIKVVWIYVAALLTALIIAKIVDAPPSTIDESKIFAPSTSAAVRDAIENEEIRRRESLSNEEIEHIVAKTVYKEIRK